MNGWRLWPYRPWKRTIIPVARCLDGVVEKVDYTDGTDSFSDSDTLDGFRIGAGVEYSFGRFSLRGEYRYSGYGEYAYDGVATGIKR